MAYTKSGQLPIGSEYKLGDYTISLSTQDIPLADVKYVYSEINSSSGGRDGKGVNLPLKRPVESWYIEATDKEVSVYARCSNDTVPHHISVVQLPNKIIYNSGDAIDLTGIVVRAFNSDGTAWENSDYPDGYIPLSELISQFRTDQKYGFNLVSSVLWRKETYSGDYGYFSIGDDDYTSISYIPYIEGAVASIINRREYYDLQWYVSETGEPSPSSDTLISAIRIDVPVGARLTFLRKKSVIDNMEITEVIPFVATRSGFNGSVKSYADRTTWGKYGGPYGVTTPISTSTQTRDVVASNIPPYYYRSEHTSNWEYARFGSSSDNWKHDLYGHPNIPYMTNSKIHVVYDLHDNTVINLYDGYTSKWEKPSVGKYHYVLYSTSQNSIPFFDLDEVINYTTDEEKKPDLSSLFERIAIALWYTDDEESRASNYTAITIAWKRPGDGAVLTTSFGIVNEDSEDE